MSRGDRQLSRPGTLVERGRRGTVTVRLLSITAASTSRRRRSVRLSSTSRIVPTEYLRRKPYGRCCLVGGEQVEVSSSRYAHGYAAECDSETQELHALLLMTHATVPRGTAVGIPRTSTALHIPYRYNAVNKGGGDSLNKHRPVTSNLGRTYRVATSRRQ